MPDEAWGGSPLPSRRGQWGLCPRWVMLSGGLGLGLCQWEDSCNTPEQRISASHPPVSPTPKSSPAPPGDGHSGDSSVCLGTLGRHKRCKRPQQARAARARPAPRTCVQSPAQPRGLCPPHVLPGRPHLAGCSCALALPRRPRLARTALCSPPACRTAGTSNRGVRTGGQVPCTRSPQQCTREGPSLGSPALLGVSALTWGGASQLLLRGGLPSPTRPWVSPGCQLHTGCCLFGVVGPALKELTSRGTNKFLACGGGQQNGGILRVKWRFPGQLGSRRPGQSAGWHPDGQRPGGGPVDPLTQEGIGLT